MVAQPSGTVSLLFSDIEGSTRLLRELGTEHYAEVLAEQRRLLRDAFSAQGGFEVEADAALEQASRPAELILA